MKRLPSLKFKDGKFKIMLMADFHEFTTEDSEKEAGSKGIYKTSDMQKLMNKSLDELKPDLVVFLGDNAKGSSDEDARLAIKKITDPISQRNIPLAIVFGNHDRESVISLERMLEIYAEENELFYTYDAKPELTGCGNCNITVKSSDGEKDVLNLWMIDSNGNPVDPTLSPYDWVHEDQVEWYKETAEKLKNENGGKSVPALWFMHIPLIEEYQFLRKPKFYEYFNSVPGHHKLKGKRYMLKDGVEGYLGEAPYCATVDSGVFKAWKETGDVIGAFFGHDHMNDFVGYLDGIMFAQNKTAGFKPYTDGCRSGVRLVTLDENNIKDIKTQMYYFKDFGLKSESLGFFEKHFTDRQIIKMKAAHWFIGGAAVLAAILAFLLK